MTIAVFATAAALVCTGPGAIDGDTLRCASGEHVRLWGVDAPEHYTLAGPYATRALARIVAGRTLRCTRKGKSYDRMVARCFVGQHDVGAIMVGMGWAVDVPKYSHGFYKAFEW